MVKIMPPPKPKPRLAWVRAWFRAPVKGIPTETCVPPTWAKLQETHPEVNVLKISPKRGKQPMSKREYRWHLKHGYPPTGSFIYWMKGLGTDGAIKKPWDE